MTVEKLLGRGPANLHGLSRLAANSSIQQIRA